MLLACIIVILFFVVIFWILVAQLHLQWQIEVSTSLWQWSVIINGTANCYSYELGNNVSFKQPVIYILGKPVSIGSSVNTKATGSKKKIRRKRSFSGQWIAAALKVLPRRLIKLVQLIQWQGGFIQFSGGFEDPALTGYCAGLGHMFSGYGNSFKVNIVPDFNDTTWRIRSRGRMSVRPIRLIFWSIRSLFMMWMTIVK